MIYHITCKTFQNTLKNSELSLTTLDDGGNFLHFGAKILNEETMQGITTFNKQILVGLREGGDYRNLTVLEWGREFSF